MPSRRFQHLSIRNKLLAMVLLPLLVALPLLGGVLLWWSNTAFDRLLVTKVRADLAVAHGYFDRVLGQVDASTAAVADSHALHVALEAARGAPGATATATATAHSANGAHGSPPTESSAMIALLQRFKAREGLDFINLRAADGTVLHTDTDTVGTGLPASAVGVDQRSVEVLALPALALLGEPLRERIGVPLVATRNAAPTTRTLEDRAMVLQATRAVRDGSGRLLGHVQTGVLLNRNLPFIDHINSIVYPEGSLPFGSRGTATLFLDDVRISTNVRLFGAEADQRAIGTRVSQTVRDAVLGEGRTWLDRAFVVNDWYVSGYQPLADSQGRRVGMLYVGFTEAPFRWVQYGALAAIGALFLVVMAGAALVCLRWARGIFEPVERMALTMQQVGGGQMLARVGGVESRDEIGQLAGHLDRLLDAVADNTRALQQWNAELDAKVEARTRELEAAQGQLVRTEKLAAVGQLTASIAHEVNNPIAVLQGNLDLVRELLGADASKVRAELALADEQIERMRLIVAQLLQFARPAEFAGYIEPVDVNRLVDDCLLLANHLLAKSRIEVKRDLKATRRPAANRQELQQVLVNLLVNAAHAMPDGGVLSLAAQDRQDDDGDAVEITVTDTGPGLGPELLRELFKPFVTRKKDGTGLGLWISRTIVDRYGGDLRAADRDDGVSGAVFIVRLRVDAAAA